MVSKTMINTIENKTFSKVVIRIGRKTGCPNTNKIDHLIKIPRSKTFKCKSIIRKVKKPAVVLL